MSAYGTKQTFRLTTTKPPSGLLIQPGTQVATSRCINLHLIIDAPKEGCAKGRRRVVLSELRGCPDWGGPSMCDYSLHSVKSRPAKVGDKLTTHDFGTGTRGFAASEDMNLVVCVLPGTELAFARDVQRLSARVWPWHNRTIEQTTAIFRQINKDKAAAHHD